MMMRNFSFEYTMALARIVLPSLVLMSISVGALADQENSKKPEDWESRLEMLRSVPYIAFSESTLDESETGVVFHNPERAYAGYNFFCNKLLNEVLLLDMNGGVVHRWKYPRPPPRKSSGSEHAVLLENGDLLVIQTFRELLRLNWNSELIWRKELEVHHDVASSPDGTIYAVTQEAKSHRGKKVRFDAILHLTEGGEEMYRWSTYDHLADIGGVLNTRSFLDTILDSVLTCRSKEDAKSPGGKSAMARRRHNYSYFNMNSISVLPTTSLAEKDSRFRGGNLLVCFRNVNQIAVLEKDTYRVLWAWGEGELEWPHHPTMLEDGHILIFDNGVQRQYSRVVELDPETEVIVWEYRGDPPQEFYSYTRGSAQRLPNGNTLICESDKGRVFEVTQEGEVVWMWVEPVAGKGLPETVYRMMRLSSARVDKLLERRW
jgi:hypothetical protein